MSVHWLYARSTVWVFTDYTHSVLYECSLIIRTQYCMSVHWLYARSTVWVFTDYTHSVPYGCSLIIRTQYCMSVHWLYALSTVWVFTDYTRAAQYCMSVHCCGCLFCVTFSLLWWSCRAICLLLHQLWLSTEHQERLGIKAQPHSDSFVIVLSKDWSGELILTARARRNRNSTQS